jgi:hypothetical protein
MVVVVEGTSDQVALETLARRREIDLNARRTSILAIGGAHALGRFLRALSALADPPAVVGLYDAGEERIVGRALEQAGLTADDSRQALQRLGFFSCDRDLEDELIRALGIAGVERVIEAQGELQSFRRLQREPAQRARSQQAQLRRFIGSHSGRKARYARALVEALELDAVPRPLTDLLERATRRG